jgi:hydrophobe/amphiphile efflux-1 (HAE1) family protein
MSLPEISIRRPVFAWMLMAALIVFGSISFKRLGISQLPDVDFPVVSVSLSDPGAAPEIIESQVLDPIEDSIMQIDGIRNVTSTAQQSSGSIAVEFELDQDIDTAMEAIENHITQVANILPTNLPPPTVRKSNPEDSPIFWLALSATNPDVQLIELMDYARNYLFDVFSTVPGVGNVALGGYVDPALRVETDLDKLDHFNLTNDDVLNALKQEHIEIPSGLLDTGDKEWNIRSMGEARTVADYGKLMINNRENQGANYKPTQLKQVATVTEATADIRKISRSNGRLAVGLGIIKQHGTNAVQVANDVRAKLKEITPLIPSKFRIDIRSDNTRFIKQSVDQLLFTLLLSALLTSAVCYLFLGSWTSTLNVLFAIPTSIVGTFIVFYFCGFTLNTFTLLGLSLAIGIVVDDAIMMLENIVRHRELGEKKREAALKGSEEITFAAMAATIAVVAIFLPVVFMKGVIGRYFFQYGITVTASVLLSLLEALTLTPMRCSRYLTVHTHPTGLAGFVDKLFGKLSKFYERVLHVLLRHRWKTVFVTLTMFAVSLLLAKQIPSEMMPAQDQSMMLLRFKLPVGTSLPVTDGKIKLIEDYLLKQKEVDGVFSAVGGFGGDAVNQGQAFVTLVDRDKRKLSQGELIKQYRKELKHMIPGMEIVVQDLSLRGFAATRGFPVEVVVQGPDWDKLTGYTNKIMDEMKSCGYMTDVNTDVQPNMPEVQLTPNRPALAKRAVALSTVTAALNALTGGEFIYKENEYPKGNHRIEVEMRLIASQRTSIPDLNRIKIRNNRGETVRLSDVVIEKVNPSLLLISRLNRARAVTVYANPTGGHSQQEALDVAEKIAKKILPPGYTMKMMGSSQSFKESFQSLIAAMLLGILVSYMVLASQFNSFVHPIAVLMALPFSFSGAFAGLWIAHQSINIYSLIGFILLMGIVKKNSILLVDFTNVCRAEGANVHDALVKACPIRLRPIIMTSVATIAGAAPEALSLGPGAETTIPMSIAIIGGVIASTILTLFVVPCVYSLLARFETPDTLE